MNSLNSPLSAIIAIAATLTPASAAPDEPIGSLSDYTPCVIAYPVFVYDATFQNLKWVDSGKLATVVSTFYYKYDPQTRSDSSANPNVLYASVKIHTTPAIYGNIRIPTGNAEFPNSLRVVVPTGRISDVNLVEPNSVSHDRSQLYLIETTAADLSHDLLYMNYTTKVRVVGTADYIDVGTPQAPQIQMGRAYSRYFRLPPDLFAEARGRVTLECLVAFEYDGNVVGERTFNFSFDASAEMSPLTDVVLRAGQPLNLTATVDGMDPAIWTWDQNGLRLADATNTLNRTAVTLDVAGVYRLTATHGDRSVFTEAEVAVIAVATDRVINVSEGESITLNGGAGEASWRWTLNGRAIPTAAGGTAPQLAIPAAAASNAGRYVLEVTNGTQILTTGTFTVNVVSIPVVAVPILSSAMVPPARVGKPIMIIIPHDMSPSRNPTSWNASNLPPGMVIDATTGTISGTPSKAGNYAVTVRAVNAAGTSQPMVVTVTVSAALSQAGTWYGLAAPGVAQGATATRIDIATSTTGVATGRLTMGSARFGFTSKLLLADDDTATLSVVVERPNPMASLPLTMRLDFVSGEMHGELIDDTEPDSLVINGWKKKTFTRTVAGYHTWLSLSPTLIEGNGPEGMVQGTTTVNGSTGTVSSVVILPDENGSVALTTSSGIGAEGQFLVYGARYSGQSLSQKRLTANGSLSGIAIITEDLDHSLSGDLTWIKGKQAKASRYYTDGFKGIVSVNGAMFVPTPKGQRHFGVTDDFSSVSLNFSGAGLEESSVAPDIEFGVSATNRLLIPTKVSGNNPCSTRVTYNARKGAFSGSFLLPDPTPLGRRISYRGIIVQTTSGFIGGGGYFAVPQLPLPGQNLVTSPVRTGAVDIGVW